MFAGIDSLIGLVIFLLISVIASWLQKKARSGEEENMPAPPPRRRQRPAGAPAPSPTQPQPKPISWEEELKRLLGDQLPEAQPAPPPPPVLVESRRPSAPPPPPPLPQEFSESTYTAEKNPVEVTFRPLPALTESVQAYEQASSLEHKVEARLREVTRKPVALTHVFHRKVSQEATEAVALVRHPKSLRSAVLASVILGPPRALAEP
ncbi:MAG: hypothetical protein HZA90_06005 [Verrucomicrobia bacterium]|nr:hypothetical protein [Verrucomicrobiota bacterium]